MKYAIVVVLLPFLVACDDEVKTGVFSLGSVNQLHYSTKTQSGLTDGNGTFKYKDGEKVTFSVGGVKLGEVKGTGTITPFDLFAATPPTDAQRVERELDDSVMVYAYEPALNVAAFLMALDVDAQPGNGIDLTGRDAQLADVRVTFAMKTEAFVVDSDDAIAAQIPNYGYHAYSIGDVIAYVYERLGIATPSLGVTQIDGDRNNDGALDGSYVFAFDSAGRVSTMKVQDAAAVVVFEASFTYDSAGRMTAITYSASTGSQTKASVFNAAGQRTSDTDSTIIGMDPEVTSRTTTYAYDALGRLTAIVDTSTYQRSTTTYAYDSAVHTLTKLTEVGPPAGALTGRYREQRVFDDDGLAVKQTGANDRDFDGTFEDVSTATYTYDANGNVAGYDSTNDDGSTGHSVYTYDGRRPLSQTSTSSSGNVYTATHTYDDAGNRTLTRYTSQAASGVAHTTQSIDYVYDGSGRLQVSDEKQFDDAGALEFEEKQTRTYNEDGTLASIRTEILGEPAGASSYRYAPVVNAVAAFLQTKLFANGAF